MGEEQKHPGAWLELDARWLLATRIVLLGTALISAALTALFSVHGEAIRAGFIFLPIAVLLAFSAISALWIKLRGTSVTFNYLQLVTDSAIVTAVVYITGGPISPFLFLYLPLVMLGSILFSRRTALIVAAINTAAYASLTLLMLNRIIPPADGDSVVHTPAGGVLFQILGLLSAMVLVGVATSFLTQKLRSSNLLVEQTKGALNELTSKHRSIEEQLEMQEKMARALAAASQDLVQSGANRSPTFVGESPVMQKVFNLISRVAQTDATVLISGESGTGKELVAKAIHSGSGNGHKPFVPVNCGAIPENLIESELFGHKKGSFTGAESDHIGLFRQAEGGTIFLDEIGELPLQMQTKLLRALQEKRVRPVGSSTDVPINVRVVSATNRNLKDEVKEGRFREDLYYRLNVISITLPALRERKEDIPLLVNAILERLVPEGARPLLPPASVQALMNYSYPGNVRELENILERAVVLGGQVVLPEHLGEAGRASSSTIAPLRETQIIVDDTIQFPVNLDDILSNVERKYLQLAMEKSSGSKKKAANLLGINFRSFRYRLQKFGISEEE